MTDFPLLLDSWAHQILKDRVGALYLKTLAIAKILLQVW
jgi:hypothetical protein